MTMTASLAELPGIAAWQRIMTSDAALAIAERNALGTTARVVVWPPRNLDAACAAVDTVLAALDQQASRFRTDSEICWIHRSGGGLFMLSVGLAEVVGVALAAARWTRGLTDPTVGNALISLGYDRDFAAIDQQSTHVFAAPAKAPGWQTVQLDGVMMRVPAGVCLDLGATAKGVGADRAGQAAISAGGLGGGVLVGLGGDISVAGTPTQDGWPVTVAEVPGPSGSAGMQLVRLPRGAIATSSTRCRQWRRAGRELHHIVDPSTGMPADGPWRTVTVAAATCADANAASTAAIVAGEDAERWLDTAGLPARLVAQDGSVRYLGGWPDADGATVPVPSGSHVYSRPLRGIR